MYILVTFDNITRNFINRTFNKNFEKSAVIRKCITANEVLINIIDL